MSHYKFLLELKTNRYFRLNTGRPKWYQAGARFVCYYDLNTSRWTFADSDGDVWATQREPARVIYNGGSVNVIMRRSDLTLIAYDLSHNPVASTWWRMLESGSNLSSDSNCVLVTVKPDGTVSSDQPLTDEDESIILKEVSS